MTGTPPPDPPTDSPADPPTDPPPDGETPEAMFDRMFSASMDKYLAARAQDPTRTQPTGPPDLLKLLGWRK